MFIFFIVNFLIGTVLASHACVIYNRFGHDDYLFTRSKCTYCHQKLALTDEIPLLSFLILKGKCRHCQNPIPTSLFIFELIGGFSFLKIDYHNLTDLRTAIILFFLLLIAIFDAQEKEFPTLFLFPIITVIFCTPNIFTNKVVTFLFSLPLIFLLLYYVLSKKLGMGDLIIYLLLLIYFDSDFANFAYLIGSLFLIAQYLFEKNNIQNTFPFVPYIYLGITLCLLAQ